MSLASSPHRALSLAAFMVGLAAVAWVASGFVGSRAFALGMTLLIGAVYLAGAWELRRFGQTTAGLDAALARVPQPLAPLADWLPGVPAPLQGAVRQRIEGDRSAFPGLALTPYLVGLLVMLGMLGTFLGMVVTFKGAVFALEGSADLAAIRAALAAPIKGLGLSFGTSVAGVATSAMLGLMATLARRQRRQSLCTLDALAATTLRPFSAAHQRQQSFAALQRQAEAMPAAAQHLQTLIEQMERRNQRLDEALLARQAEFQREAAAAYTGLANSVEQSLRERLAGSAAESTRLHEGVNSAVQAQLEGLSARFASTTATVADTWTQALAQHQQGGQRLLQGLGESLAAFNASFEQRSAQLLAGVQATQAEAQAQRAQAEQAQQATLRSEEARRGEVAAQRAAEMHGGVARQLQALREDEAARGDAAVARLTDLRSALATQLATLAERADLVGQIGGLLRQVQTTTGEQRAAIEHLVGAASSVLDRVGQQFADTVGAQAGRAEALAGQAATSAAQLASLGAAFQQGTAQLADSHEQLVQSLQRVEAAIGQSMARSDEQLAYCVAQAREVIDLSISAQQGIVEDLRQLRGPIAKATAGAVA